MRTGRQRLRMIEELADGAAETAQLNTCLWVTTSWGVMLKDCRHLRPTMAKHLSRAEDWQ